MQKLLTLTLALAGLAACGGVAAAQQGSDSSRDYGLAGFDRVSTAGPQRVVITVGPAASVRATGPLEALDLLEVDVDGGELRIGPKHDRRSHDDWRDIDWDKLEPITFQVTVPRLEAASLAGSGRVEVDRVDGREFGAAVAGSGQLEVASLSVDNARFSVAGSGGLIARGRAREARVSIAGSGEVRAREVASEAAWVSIVGSGDAALTVDDDAHVSIMGSGDVDIAGPARCSVSRMGSGRVTCNGTGQESWRS